MSYHGYGIAALAFSAMISAPIYARIGDKLMSCKIVLRVGIVFSIVGNFVYFAFPNANMIIVARMISGLGWGLEGSFDRLFAATCLQKTCLETGFSAENLDSGIKTDYLTDFLER